LLFSLPHVGGEKSPTAVFKDYQGYWTSTDEKASNDD
jgi:hypothetical protein